MTPSWIAFTLYSMVAIGLGVRSYLNHDSADSFWTAGRSLGGTSVGLSISAGFMSVSWSCVYAVQLFYWYGLGALWLVSIPWVLSLIGLYLLSRKYHMLPAFSQPQMVRQRFGRGAGNSVALALVAVFLVWAGAEMYIAATLLTPQLGIGVTPLILILGFIVAIYATLGGFGAVVATDKMQYGLVALYIFAMAWLAYAGLSSSTLGWPGADVLAAKSGKSWNDFMSPGIVVILLTFIAYLPGWIFQADLWLRVQGAKDERSAKSGLIFAGISATIFVGILPLFIGIGALSLFPLEMGNFPQSIGFEGDAIFAALVSSYAPDSLALLVAVGLIATAMSTIDTCVNVMALSIGYDLMQLGSKRGSQSISRVVTLASVLAATIFALFTQSLWDIFYLSSGILTTAVAFPVAAIFWKSANRRGVFFSSVAGFVGIILAYFGEAYGNLSRWEPDWLADSGLGFIIIGIAIAAVGYVAGSRQRSGAPA